MTIKSFFTLLLIAILFLSSCKKEDAILADTNLIDTSNHHIQIQETDDIFQISIEVLSDSTDNIIGSFPNVDFINFAIDANRNAMIDANIDFGFSNIPNMNDALCSYFFLENEALTPCGGFETTGSIAGIFEASDQSEQAHVIWTLRIPKSDLDTTNPLHFVIKIFSDQEAYTTFPRGTELDDEAQTSFSEVLTYEWN